MFRHDGADPRRPAGYNAIGLTLAGLHFPGESQVAPGGNGMFGNGLVVAVVIVGSSLKETGAN